MNDIFDRFKKLKVLVIGDLILDKYYFTDVSRISPEAPIPIAKYISESNNIGGAGNVALNFKNLGLDVILIGKIGKDNEGNIIKSILDKKQIKFLPTYVNSKTITKIRITSKHNQILRLDFENIDDYFVGVDNILESIKSVISDVDFIIISDYNKGVVNKEIINYIFKFNKYVAIDCKNYNLFDSSLMYSLIKPNFKEAVEIAKKLGSNIDYRNNNDDVAKLGLFLKKYLNSNILITRGSKGVSYIGDNIVHENINETKIIDVTGAGDTSIAIFSILNYLNYDIKTSLSIMNAAAKITVSNLGTYAPTIDEIKEELFKDKIEQNIVDLDRVTKLVKKLKKEHKKIVFTNGCFDLLHKGHVYYLNEAKKKGDVLIVGLNSDYSVKKLKGSSRPVIDELSRAFVLANLKSVDYVVIFNEKTPINLIKRIRPHVHVKGGDYKKEDLIETSVVESYGGKVEIIDYIPDVSTSKIMQKINRRVV